MDYYGHGATLVLERPLALCSFMGGRAPEVAQAICATTGLPLSDIARQVEGFSGRTRAETQLRHGHDARMKLEREQLEAALRRSPPPVIALTEDLLLETAVQERVLATCDLVYIEWSLVELAANIRRRLDEQPGAWPAFILSEQITALGIQPLLDARVPGYRRAKQTIVGQGRTPWQIAKELVAGLNG